MMPRVAAAFVFFRSWGRIAATFPAEQFDPIPDKDLPRALCEFAATWMDENFARLNDEYNERYLAAKQRHEELRIQFGIRPGSPAPDRSSRRSRKRATQPSASWRSLNPKQERAALQHEASFFTWVGKIAKWIPPALSDWRFPVRTHFLLVEDIRLAEEIVTALSGMKPHVVPGLRFGAISAADVSRPERATIELEIEGIRGLAAQARGAHLVSILRAGDGLLRVLKPQLPAPPVTAASVTIPVAEGSDGLGTHLSADVFALLKLWYGADAASLKRGGDLQPRELAALLQFLRVCGDDEGLDKSKPTEAHWEAAGRQPAWKEKSFPTWRRDVSEALRKVLGSAKARRQLSKRTRGEPADPPRGKNT